MRAWSIFYRASKHAWVVKYAPDWAQKLVPREMAPSSSRRDERAAEDWAKAFVAGLDIALVAAPPEPTLVELAPRFLGLKADDERKARSTKAEYEGHLRLSLLPQLGHLRPSQIDIRALRELLRHLRRHGGEDSGPLGCSTVRNRYSTLKVFLRAIAAEGWGTVNLALLDDASVLEELPEPERSKRRVLRPEGFAELVQCATVPEIWRIRYLLAAGAGMADGEIAGLRVRDVADELLRIERAVALRGPAGHATPSRPKNRFRVRDIPQHPAIVAAIAWWLADGFERHVCRPPRPDDWLLPRANGMPCRPKSAAILREHLELAGVDIPEGFTFHALRACFATWLERHGASDEQRARLMGHRGKSTAARCYVSEPELLELDRAAIARLPIPVDFGAGSGADGTSLEPPSGFEPETYGLRRRKRPGSVVPLGEDGRVEAPDSGSGNGREAGDGRSLGATLVPGPLPVELHELRGALRGLVTPWDAAEATLEGLGR